MGIERLVLDFSVVKVNAYFASTFIFNDALFIFGLMITTYHTHLSLDKKLIPLINKVGEIKLTRHKRVYLHLCSSIISQQLSVKAAATIYKRFLEACGGSAPSMTQILETPDEKLRAAGLSNAKVVYIKNVCNFFTEHNLTDTQLYKMENEEIIQLLTQIKGVGRWTVEMILMFTLARENVFAPDDLGIQQAMIHLYKLDASDKKTLRTQMLKQAAKWASFQTYACMYLWRFKDK
jgi:DNA-3-methyladenine glycosylase II